MSCKWNWRAVNTSLLLAALAGSAVAMPLALPGLVKSMLPDARAVGHGTLRWLGFHVYDATLWTDGAAWSERVPFALDIRYARSVPGHKLAETSVDEMRRLNVGSEEQLQRWGHAMNLIFPDVAPGDRLIGFNLPERGVAFYSAKRLLGYVNDVNFARAFFAIWLDARTSKPELRDALLGSHGRNQ
jgi:hypothetical protein